MEKSIKRYFPIFLGPTFLAFIIGFIVPFLMGIYLSFCDFRTVREAGCDYCCKRIVYLQSG